MDTVYRCSGHDSSQLTCACYRRPKVEWYVDSSRHHGRVEGRQAVRMYPVVDLGRYSHVLYLQMSSQDNQDAKDKQCISVHSGQIGGCTGSIEHSQIRVSRHSDTSTTARVTKMFVQCGSSSRSSETKSLRSSFSKTFVGKAF